MKKLISLYLLLAGMFVIISCNKFDEEFKPPYHQNIFRCKINGVEWTPYLPEGSQWGWLSKLSSQYYDDGQRFSIVSIRKLEDESIEQAFNIALKMITVGNNKIKYFDEIFTDWLNPSGCKFYALDTLASHEVDITRLDTIEKIIQGTFEFTAVNDCGHTVNITEGTFDLQPTWFE